MQNEHTHEEKIKNVNQTSFVVLQFERNICAKPIADEFEKSSVNFVTLSIFLDGLFNITGFDDLSPISLLSDKTAKNIINNKS